MYFYRSPELTPAGLITISQQCSRFEVRLQPLHEYKVNRKAPSFQTAGAGALAAKLLEMQARVDATKQNCTLHVTLC